MDLYKAIILGLVEGLTEFIPVSSTGHLILFGEALDFNGPLAETFEIFIQLGAILAVVCLYFERFKGLWPWQANGSGFRGFRGLILLVLGCLPAFVSGALLHGFIKEHLFSPLTVAAALLVGGVLMVLLERRQRTVGIVSLDQLGPRQALLIGCAQCLALWPGVSRSAATIIGGLLCGLERRIAAEFSFLLAVPLMCAAVSYDLLKSIDVLSLAAVPFFALGFLVSFFSAILAIRVLLHVLGKYSLAPFGWYRIALGLLVLVMLWR